MIKKVNISKLPLELKDCTIELLRAEGVEACEDGLCVTAKAGERMRLKADGAKAEIEYAEKVQFFRALSYICGEDICIEQTPLFDKNGLMLDCSRNAVAKTETIKFIIRKMALMGLNTLMLYTEDTYEIENRPYFGYLRGRYTYEELKALDDYAYGFGIELVPCIQTLAHLERTLRWPQVDSDMRDTDDILMVGEEKVYEFIEDMIKAASAPYRTKRIHIGMDEAWSLGLGNYRFKNGIVPSHKIMEQHLKRVREILSKYGLEPMMWSDMYIRAASPNGEYYNATKVPAEVIKSSYEDCSLVYWDYYHEKTKEYEKEIELHKQFPAKTIFAGGVWTWDGIAPAYDKAIKTSVCGLTACKNKGITEVFATAWGDNGAETNALSVLPGLQLYAEFSYTHSHNLENLKSRFYNCTGEKADLFLSLTKLNHVPGMKRASTAPIDTAKFLLYEDPLMPLFYKDLQGLALAGHYKGLYLKYSRARSENESFRLYYSFYKELSKALWQKCIWRDSAADCIKSKNRKAALMLSKNATAYAKQIKALKAAWQLLWDNTSKEFGFEIIDTRLSALVGRYETACVKMKLFSEGKLDDIETLSCEKLRFLTNDSGEFNGCYNWNSAISACKI